MQQNRILTESNGLGKTQEGELASKIANILALVKGRKNEGERQKRKEKKH